MHERGAAGRFAGSGIAGTLLLAAASTGLLVAVAAPAPAAPTSPDRPSDAQLLHSSLLQSAWFWTHVSAAGPVALGSTDPEPSEVPPGDLPVASNDGQGDASKESLLAFDMSAVPAGATVTAFTVVLTLDPAAPSLDPSPPALVVELAQRGFTNGQAGTEPVDMAPPTDTSHPVSGSYNAKAGTYTFALPTIAQSWVDDVNNGLAVLPTAADVTPFQLSFLGGAKVSAKLSFQPPAATPIAVTQVSAAPAGSVGSAGSLGSGGTGNVPVQVPGALVPNAPGLAGGGSPAVPPQVATSSAPPATQSTAAAEPATVAAIRGPQLVLPLLGVVGVAALLLLVSLTVGGVAPAPAGLAGQTSRLTQVLRARAGPFA